MVVGGWLAVGIFLTRNIWHPRTCNQDGSVPQAWLIRSPVKSLLAPLAGSHKGSEHASPETKCFILSQNFGETWPDPFTLGLAAEPNQRQLLGCGPLWSWPAPSASSKSSPACSLQSHLEPWVSVAIRACNRKIQDDSIWENSLFTKTQAILRNHPEIQAGSFFFFLLSVSEPSLGSTDQEENTDPLDSWM